MDDSQIIKLFFERSEEALRETEAKYGRLCFRIAQNILGRDADAEECVNDAFLCLWNAIPPHRPAVLSTFLGKIARRLSLKKRREKNADKRGGGVLAESLDELEDCVPSGQRIDEEIEAKELTGILNAFLGSLPADERRVFLRRYWYFDSVREIAARYGFGESRVKMMLKRARDRLRRRLEEEDYGL